MLPEACGAGRRVQMADPYCVSRLGLTRVVCQSVPFNMLVNWHVCGHAAQAALAVVAQCEAELLQLDDFEDLITHLKACWPHRTCGTPCVWAFLL